MCQSFRSVWDKLLGEEAIFSIVNEQKSSFHLTKLTKAVPDEN